uniref:Uncharacterized protein n=1 Tax=Picea glauca TaxID=3330 RepID=A0A117NH06_PICGL|nr:hypothetical protein ABT39_MTgene5799 [Picea glauca]
MQARPERKEGELLGNQACHEVLLRSRYMHAMIPSPLWLLGFPKRKRGRRKNNVLSKERTL